MSSGWDEVLEIAKEPRRGRAEGRQYYLNAMRNLHDVGVNFASGAVAEAWTKCIKADPERAIDKIRKTTTEGFVILENHDYTMSIVDYISRCLTDEVDVNDYILLPVYDDKEYICWTFVFVREKDALELVMDATN
jgi:hypothetical protein